MNRLLLISNSTNYGEAYLGWPRKHISDFMKDTGVNRILFVPYAGVGLSAEGLESSYEAYEAKVNDVFRDLGYEIYSIHKEPNPVVAVKQADAIAVGGGNTFHLVAMLHELNLMGVIRERVLSGMHYMGWSAGANIACPTLRTTNDMPIIQPESFKCLNLLPFQINPHYLDANPEGHGGETREQRIEEFLVINRKETVVGLRESCLLRVEGTDIQLIGSKPMRVFRFGQKAAEYQPGDDLAFLVGD